MQSVAHLGRNGGCSGMNCSRFKLGFSRVARQFSGAPEPSPVIGAPGNESELARRNVVRSHRARLVRSAMFRLIIDQKRGRYPATACGCLDKRTDRDSCLHTN